MHGSTGIGPLDDHEVPFPTGGDAWISDAYVVGAEVDAEQWPDWTDEVAFTSASEVEGVGRDRP